MSKHNDRQTVELGGAARISLQIRLTDFTNCECVGVPSGAVVRVVPVLFVRDSFVH
jgi:hypothetical protein